MITWIIKQSMDQIPNRAYVHTSENIYLAPNKNIFDITDDGSIRNELNLPNFLAHYNS